MTNGLGGDFSSFERDPEDLAEEIARKKRRPNGTGGSGEEPPWAKAKEIKPEKPKAKKAANGKTTWPFRLTKRGVEHLVETKDPKTGEPASEWRWICSYLDVAALTRSVDGEDWGRLLIIEDSDGRRHEWAMPMAMLAGSGEDVRARLLSMGLSLSSVRNARSALNDYLITAKPKTRAQAVIRIGWHETGAGRVFVLPDGAIGEAATERLMLLQHDGSVEHAFREAGNLADWQQHVAAYAVGNSRLAVAISTALAAPLLHLVGAESGGVHLRGASSIGKTTALAVAGSVWGGGGIRGYIRQWRATDNGLEGIAALHNDAFLALDELSQIDAKSAANVAYMLANGSGKGRAGRGGEARRAQSWRVVFLSTGELGLADKIAEDHGRRATAGQQVRVLDVPADAGAGMGIFEDLHGFATAQALVNHLRRATGSYYGAAIRPYLETIAKTAETIVDDARSSVKEFADRVCDDESSGQVHRAAERFGLIAFAGELAVRIGILPWPEGEAADAAEVSFKAWVRERGGHGPAEVNAAIQQIRLFIERYGSSRFEPTVQAEHARIISDRAGYRRDDDGGWLVFPEVWKRELLAGFSAGSINKALIERGLLIPDSNGSPSSVVKLQGKSRRLYHLSEAILEGIAEAAAAA